LLGVYFHIPFCKKACHYCDFHFSTQLNGVDGMMSAMSQELDWHLSHADEQTIRTIYFGGGTPSVIAPSYIGKLIDQLSHNRPLERDVEITVEINPDDVSSAVIREWKAMGVNRFSMGVQSFDDAVLKWMNRAHAADQADRAIKTLQDAGLTNLTIDLIYGHGRHETMTWEQDVERFLSYQTPHISAYALTVEEKTALGYFTEKGEYAPMHDESVVHQFLDLHQQLTQAGFEHYELSNYARSGFQSKHNTSYWQGIPFWGIGPSAHGFDGQATRKMNINNNPRYVKAWNQGAPRDAFEIEHLTPVQLANEYWMTGLRTAKGVDLNAFEIRWGLQLEKENTRLMDKWISSNHLALQENRLTCTPRGWMVMDAILSDMFLTETKN
jgi:oxygen-independent coproporphyrinogen-3 oxidase